MKIGFALTGSFCTFSKIFPVMEALSKDYELIPIVSDAVSATDSRFGTAAGHRKKITEICKRPPLDSIAAVEPIGPKKLLDALIVAPCTGNTLAKLSLGIADTPVTMAVKSHLRNGRPVLIAVSTNDALGAAAENIGRLLARKHFYFVPFSQDAPEGKPCSCVAHFERIPDALEAALRSEQLQPLILRK